MSTTDHEQLDLVRRRVVNVVGHELRTPLTTIRGLVDLLADADEDERESVIIPALQRNARRAEHLLDDLLIAGDVSTAMPTVPPAAVDVVGVLREVLDEIGDEGRHPVAMEGTAPVSVLAHDEAVRRACTHLVENAAAYADGESTIDVVAGDPVTVRFTTPVDAPVRNLDLAFELFFRGETAVTRAAGLGVGLPVARSLARMDGGDVTITQVDGAVVAELTLPGAP